MQKEIIAIIGGPGAGKSAIIDGLTAYGYCCYPEISRQVTLEAQKQGIEQLFLEQPLLFSEKLLKERIKQYENAQQEPSGIVFIDRGIPDIVAYMDYTRTTYSSYFEKACQECGYSKIFLLPPWKEIYTNDGERYKNFEQVEIIHNRLVTTYKKYDYKFIEIPKDTFPNRVSYYCG